MFRLSSFVVVIIIGIVSLDAVESAAVQKLITGKVTHAGLKELPKNSQVKVELRDTSLMDAAAVVLGMTAIVDPKSFPISYSLKYNPTDIKLGHTYSMSARISGSDGQLRYINDVHTRAELTGASSPGIDIAVIQVGGSPTTSGPQTGSKKVCSPVNCRGKSKACPYGYHKKDGCEICKCNDPCNPPGKPILCGPKQRCFVDKKANGTFGTRCDAVPAKGDKYETKVSKAVCKEAKATGLCMASMPRFYYNPTTNRCDTFIYGGCGGNGNNFHTKVQCERACKA